MGQKDKHMKQTTIYREAMAKSNPKVDYSKVQETLETIKMLRKQGVRAAEYDLLPPFSRRLRTTCRESAIKHDPRAVRLRGW
jgi:hypothetical protein